MKFHGDKAVEEWIHSLTFILFLSFAEPLPTCAARVDALRSHGHYAAALRLAVSVVRTMKQQQLDAQRQWHESQTQKSSSSSQQSYLSRCNDSHHSNSCSRCYSYDHRSNLMCSPRCVSSYDPHQACSSRSVSLLTSFFQPLLSITIIFRITFSMCKISIPCLKIKSGLRKTSDHQRSPMKNDSKLPF